MHRIGFHFFLAKCGGPLDWAIALFSGGRFSHVEVELDAVTVPVDGQAARKVTSRFFSARPSDGVSFHTLPGYVPSQWVRRYIDVNDAQYAAILAYCGSIDGDKYDWFSVITFDCCWTIYDPQHREFCSEVGVEVLRTIRGLAVDLNPYKTSPSALELFLRATESLKTEN